MSGGLYNGKTLNHFWIVNKKDYQIFKKTMPMFKKYHSMLYIPDNFVFIAGGDSLITFIYDIENKQFIKWAYMNKKHFQPGLIIVLHVCLQLSCIYRLRRQVHHHGFLPSNPW